MENLKKAVLLNIFILLMFNNLYCQEKTENKAAQENQAKKPFYTICAVSGVKIEVTDKTPYSDYNGIRYYFANENVKKSFDKAQWKYANNMLTCKVCGAQELKNRRSFVQSKYNGKSYDLCSSSHKAEFEKTPEKYIKNIALPAQASENQSLLVQIKVLDCKFVDFLIKGKEENQIKVLPSKGAKFLEMKVEVKNISDHELKFLGSRWSLIDDNGNVHKPIIYDTSKISRFLDRPLQPELTMELDFTFEIAKERTALKLEVYEGTKTSTAFLPALKSKD